MLFVSGRLNLHLLNNESSFQQKEASFNKVQMVIISFR